MQNHFKYIFVILVYRNVGDLVECIQSIQKNVQSFKVVVVNSFFDADSCTAVEEAAKEYGCDFVNVENKGYSYGNNRGIEYVVNHYGFDFLIVSNPDIVINTFDDTVLIPGFPYDVIAPRITTANGRAQNPMYVRPLRFAERIEHFGFKNKINLLVYLSIFASKCSRWINRIAKRGKSLYGIYCAHGSFVILSRKFIEILSPVYDEEMFLFAEEMVLAVKAQEAGLKVCYYDGIQINHKEDGSMNLSNLKMYDVLRASNLYYYDHYFKKK